MVRRVVLYRKETMNKNKETTILDSSLNTCNYLNRPIFKYQYNYNIKVIDLQGYKQVYIYPLQQHKLLKGYEKNDFKDLDLITESNYIENFNENEKKQSKIDFKNVMRAKLKCQRLIKANDKVWKTFITLTFKENITDLSIAYKKLSNCLRYIKSRIKNDFKWVCIPEYQKSGRVHYHLITNIELNDTHLVSIQNSSGQFYYHLKLWEKIGFNSIEEIKDKDGNDNKKICGYISKYMTKQYIEDSFFNKNRYYSSQNLNRPKDYYIDTNSEKGQNLFEELLRDNYIIYTNDYKDTFDNQIQFFELKKLD